MTTETQAAFARRIGVSRPYVAQLKREGRLVMDAAGLVEVEASLTRIKATEDPAKARKVSNAIGNKKTAPLPISDPASNINEPNEAEEPRGDLRHWQTEKTKEDAKKACIERMKMEKSIVMLDDAVFAIRDVAAGVRSRMENIPARWAPVLAPMTDLNQIQATLTELVENELRAMTHQQIKRTKELAGAAE